MCNPVCFKCSKRSCFLFNAIVFSFYVVGISVWAGIFFGVYYPLVKRDYKEAPCIVSDFLSFTIADITTRNYHSYSLYIYINNSSYRAYGCISDSAEMIISSPYMGIYYPYMYTPCDDSYYVSPSDSCLDDQLFLPLWTCKNASYAYLPAGSSFTCKWWLADKDGETDPAKSENITYPGYGNSWIEVLFKDDVYIPTDDYNALWVIPFGFLTIIPLIIVVWFNCGIYCCGYSAEFKQLFAYWYTKYIKCKRAKKPYGYYESNKAEMDKKLSTIAFLMALTKGKYASKFPKSLIKNTAGYF
ncbi:unnamed protein product [Blepharisma stoltei]|uniref:Uncharacterized protein n=1 Tax=Blepharisma stoltei TaxID=1481888 RepID=A0AAU9K7I4_9CILI|nr:unnamed protein product [Blepharisma stoltei]